MISVLTSGAEDRVFEPRPNTFKLVFAALSMQHLGVRTWISRPRVRIICLDKVARLPVDSCFREIAR